MKKTTPSKITNLSNEELLITLEKEVCTRSFYEFFRMASKVLYPSTDWDYNWHFKYIADILQDEVSRITKKEMKTHDYIINLPFRSGKSILISVLFPVWVWIKNPSLSVMTVSATDSLAIKFSHQSKILIDSKWFQSRFGECFKLRMDTKAKGNFMNDHGGRRESFGINSSIIGAGCDIMLMDDIQSPDNVTAVGLKNVIESYTDLLYTRLNDPDISLRIILQQRVHENDISGYLMSTNADKYFNICLPAILSADLNPKYLAEFYEDDLFWKTRFSEKVIADFKSTMRPAPFAGQLLQRPVPEEGNLIKRNWFKIIKMSECMKLGKGKICLFVDTAFTDKQKNDPSSFLLCVVIFNKMYILKAENYWKEFNELMDMLKEWIIVYKVDKVYVEPKASGQSVVQELKRQLRGSTHVMMLASTTKSKMERINVITPQLIAEKVVLVEDGWNNNFLNQCASFPFGVHDDLVDCLAYAVQNLLVGRYLSSPHPNSYYEDDGFDLYQNDYN